MTFKNIAILGAGAVGSYLLWGLSQKEDLNISVIAAGERKERFEKNGFVINDQACFPAIRTPEEAHGVDLLFVTVKYGGLSSALEVIPKIADQHTMVISLMNGVDSEQRIAEILPKEQIMPGFIKISSERRGNSIHFDPEVTIGIFYGEAPEFNGIDGTVTRERIDAVTELFNGTGLHYQESGNIFRDIWTKYQLNIAWNIPQAIINCGLGAYVASEHVEWLQHELNTEVAAVAKARGILLPERQDLRMVGTVSRPDARYSTLQDLDAGRHTEIDMFCGAMIRMGEEYGIPVPYNKMAYHLVKALEEKNDGVFNF